MPTRGTKGVRAAGLALATMGLLVLAASLAAAATEPVDVTTPDAQVAVDAPDAPPLPDAPALPPVDAPLPPTEDGTRAAPELPVATSPTLPLKTWGRGAPGPLAPTGLRGAPTKGSVALSDVLGSPEAQAVAGAAGVAGLALALGARPFLLALAPLYSRLDKGELLEHPARRELVATIREEPGINQSDLQQRFQMGWGALLYHLQRLEAQGIVVSNRWGRSRRYFVNDRSVLPRAEGIRALKAPNARQLAELVVAHPGSTQEELAQSMGLSRSVVSKYATRLEQASLLQREVGRNCFRLFPTGDLRDLLHTSAPGAPLAPPMPATTSVEAEPLLTA
jgi:DNA-binding MarR family transcriptional regulator